MKELSLNELLDLNQYIGVEFDNGHISLDEYVIGRDICRYYISAICNKYDNK
jgi:hypothetical protein